MSDVSTITFSVFLFFFLLVTVLGFAAARWRRAKALDNLDAILDVPGIDAIYVGPSDLGFSLGLPPVLDREEPAVLDILARLVRETGRRGIAAGIHCGTSAYAARAIGMGFRLVTVGSDSALMLQAARAAVQGVRGGGVA